jgi:hypothetical protein
MTAVQNEPALRLYPMRSFKSLTEKLSRASPRLCQPSFRPLSSHARLIVHSYPTAGARPVQIVSLGCGEIALFTSRCCRNGRARFKCLWIG